jgi:hypothetical protein
MAEIIRENNRQKFKTTADVIRAAFYIGIHVLYVMFENGNGDQFGQGLYDFMQRNEAYYRKNQVLDDVVLEIKRLSEVMDKQYITWDEFLGNVETIIKQAPPEIMADAIEVSQKVLAAKYTKGSGIKISELFKNHHRKNMME